PQPVPSARPEVALAVLIQTHHSVAKTIVLSVALDVAIANCAQSPSGNSQCTDPHGAVTILKEGTNRLSSEFRGRSKLGALPTYKPVDGADPKSPVARDEQLHNIVRGEILIARRLPGNGPDTIEAKQPEFGTQPEITVGRLSNGVDGAFGKAVADLPRR